MVGGIVCTSASPVRVTKRAITGSPIRGDPRAVGGQTLGVTHGPGVTLAELDGRRIEGQCARGLDQGAPAYLVGLEGRVQQLGDRVQAGAQLALAHDRVALGEQLFVLDLELLGSVICSSSPCVCSSSLCACNSSAWV